MIIKLTDEADVGHEAAVVVVMRAAGDGVRRHLAVHVEVSEPRPAATQRDISEIILLIITYF